MGHKLFKKSNCLHNSSLSFSQLRTNDWMLYPASRISLLPGKDTDSPVCRSITPGFWGQRHITGLVGKHFHILQMYPLFGLRPVRQVAMEKIIVSLFYLHLHSWRSSDQLCIIPQPSVISTMIKKKTGSLIKKRTEKFFFLGHQFILGQDIATGWKQSTVMTEKDSETVCLTVLLSCWATLASHNPLCLPSSFISKMLVIWKLLRKQNTVSIPWFWFWWTCKLDGAAVLEAGQDLALSVRSVSMDAGNSTSMLKWFWNLRSYLVAVF